jgi:hypothetical protein
MLPPEKQKQFLIGFFRGDGHVNKVGLVSVVVVNKNLIFSCWQMLVRLKISAVFRKLSRSKLSKYHPYYCSFAPNNNVSFDLLKQILVGKALKKRIKNSNRTKIWKYGEVFLHPIKNISKRQMKTHVYNLKVEKDHTYLASGVSVHNCFCIPISDTLSNGIDGILDTQKNAAIIHKTGGGTGFDFSDLRPSGELVSDTVGVSSGPVAFLKMYDATTNAIKSGGKRRGANIGILRVDHPDIFKFIECKKKEGDISNFNISIGITDNFMNAVKNDKNWDLVWKNKVYETVKALDLWNLILDNSHSNGEPGILFLDTANKNNIVSSLGSFKSTNPCGELFLLPFESCNLGSLNLSNFYD